MWHFVVFHHGKIFQGRVNRRESFLHYHFNIILPLNAEPCFKDICVICKESNHIYIDKEASRVCTFCGESSTYEISIPTESYENPRRRKRSRNICPIKRLNHFKYWLERFQAKEESVINGEDLSLIIQGLRQDRLTPSYENIRLVIQRRKKRGLYDHIFKIQKIITGEPLVYFTAQQLDILCRLFMALQERFIKMKTSRINMLSYPFVITKLCAMCGWTTLSESIPRLRSPFKIRQQEYYWSLLVGDEKLCLSEDTKCIF